MGVGVGLPADAGVDAVTNVTATITKMASKTGVFRIFFIIVPPLTQFEKIGFFLTSLDGPYGQADHKKLHFELISNISYVIYDHLARKDIFIRP